MPTAEEVRRWGLVLDAEDIPYDTAYGPEGPTLVVAPEDAERAAEVLQAYYRENADRLTAEAELEPDGVGADAHGTPWAVASALCVVAAMAAFEVFVIRADDTRRWFAAGAGDSTLIRAGEWWRTVTALTLHVDLAHLLSNMASGALLFTLVFALLGPGAGAVAVLVAGAGGNLLNAWIHGDGHSAVGASTAVMGALGILAGAALARGSGPVGKRRWGWAPLFAAVMLLVLTGLGPETDILAHLLGFLVGLPVGYLAARVALPRRGWPTQAGLALLAASALAGCWALALARS